MSLPDGIYLRPTTIDTKVIATFVSGGQWDDYWPHVRGLDFDGPYGVDTSTWTRIADLPDLRMSEPTQIGYPVMAGCEETGAEHLHIFAPHNAPSEAWTCAGALSHWDHLEDPRDLTPDEIAEHNLWTGAAR